MNDFTLDTRQFAEAMRFVVKATGKDSADVLNRAALHAVIGGKGVRGAMQRTPKADKSKIRGLTERQLAGAVAARNRGKKWAAGEFAQAIKKERARRIRSSGYTANAGWSNAAKAFGGTGARSSRGVQGGFKKSIARFGYGDKSKPSHLVAEIANTAPAAEKIGYAPLQDALNDVARDMVEYANRKLQKTFDKVNR